MNAGAECRGLLADGRWVTVSATLRPRANRADVKCAVPGAPALAERMQDVVRLARHTETVLDSRSQVLLTMEPAPPAAERGWELAAVLADRMARGVYRPAQHMVYASGWSERWHEGRIDAGSTPAQAPSGATLIVGGAAPDRPGAALYLEHLGGLLGHPDPGAAVSSARAWFPLHSGGVHDSLAWVEVSVYPLPAPTQEEEDSIAAPGLDAAQLLAVRQALVAARQFDPRGLGRWRSVVRFSETRFQGRSYELALVMADRIARGREYLARGRLIASGCSGAWQAGRVDSVEGRAPKCELILREAAAGDRVLLPLAWREHLAPGFADGLRASGASLACVDRIAML